jgi:hypothetical protein
MVHLHDIFSLLFFFSSKAPTQSPDSYPKFVSNIKSNSPRYSNYSSLCVDSYKEEVIFCFKLHTNYQHFMVDICPNEHSMVNFSISYPFKGARAGHVLYACFALVHLPQTESTRSETPRQLSQCGVRLHVN